VSECLSTNFKEEDETKGIKKNELKDICVDQNNGIQNSEELTCSKDEDACCTLNDANKSNANNCSRIQDYRLNLTGVEGTILEAVPEDSAVHHLPASEHCSVEKPEERLFPAMDSHKSNENFIPEVNINNTNLQELSHESPQVTTCQHELKKEYTPVPPFYVPESNASDVSECSIATNATCVSQRDKYLNQIMTKTEALTARQQVALWLTRTSMSDLSSMPSLKNIVYPHSVANKEPPSRSSQSSHCSCYHHTHDKQCIRRSYGNNNCNSRPLSTAMSDCCFDTTTVMKQPNHCIHSSASPYKANMNEGKRCNDAKSNNIKRNYSTKSLMGGFSFGFRGVGSSKTFNDNKREKTSEEKESLMPSPIAFRKCETVIALSGASPDSPAGTEGTIDDSGQSSNIATSTVVKRRHHHFYNHPSSHSCSVNNVRLHCGHGNINQSTENTPHTSKRSTSLSLFKKLSLSNERSCNR
jgi:hypothetical protein